MSPLLLLSQEVLYHQCSEHVLLLHLHYLNVLFLSLVPIKNNYVHLSLMVDLYFFSNSYSTCWIDSSSTRRSSQCLEWIRLTMCKDINYFPPYSLDYVSAMVGTLLLLMFSVVPVHTKDYYQIVFACCSIRGWTFRVPLFLDSRGW